ncbi:hypothetical protein CHLRE_09g390171v5 [Chlamydomonas reinhardtii]|uniref:Protein kinase domain-containing protein n=1 Tax=Chlamydomonas reinhardtii TaxID=3055 RepID=A0A2K3DE25_CHLRE|nr:uncharacterized protein CHLRE_09g390171v5 [Chlamydomonas reinhardtii]PNW78788.1 hypothetical protein CHLRE_09g390171v5 [Chlamydomonas reinhardtii]
MREEYLKPSSDRAASTPTEPSIVGRLPTPAMLLSLRTHGFVTTDGWGPSGVGAASPSIFTNGGDSPTAGDGRPYSIDFMAMGLGDLGNSASESASGPVSICGLQPQLRFSTAGQLAHEVAALHLLGRGGYGVVLSGNWKQEGRVAVKVLVSDEKSWMDSCYKEAVLSKCLAHPNCLQTYDFQSAVLTEADVQRARASWEAAHTAVHSGARDVVSGNKGAGAGGSLSAMNGGDGAVEADARMDSFELLPPPCGSLPEAGCAGARLGTTGSCTDLWQVLFMLGARAGQFLTLIVMEYAEVGTLQRAISAGAFREGGRLSKWAALRSLLVTAKEIAGGMCLLHSYKIIHGDLSPTNVMLRASRIDKRGFVAKVADFGLSKVTASGVARTEEYAGQAQYLAPECLDYEARLASDVFAFGVLLYEMAVGCKAFAEYQPAQILVGRITGDLELHWPAEAPAEVRALAERCMQLDPDVRPSFREVVEELRRQDNEAKMAHRQYNARRRSTMEGLASGGPLPAVRQMSSLGPHRSSTALGTCTPRNAGNGTGSGMMPAGCFGAGCASGAAATISAYACISSACGAVPSSSTSGCQGLRSSDQTPHTASHAGGAPGGGSSSVFSVTPLHHESPMAYFATTPGDSITNLVPGVAKPPTAASALLGMAPFATSAASSAELPALLLAPGQPAHLQMNITHRQHSPAVMQLLAPAPAALSAPAMVTMTPVPPSQVRGLAVPVPVAPAAYSYYALAGISPAGPVAKLETIASGEIHLLERSLASANSSQVLRRSLESAR